MRYTIVLIFSMMLFLGGTTTLEAQKKSKDRDDFHMKVDGLGCAYCAYGLEKKFMEFKGIKNLKIELETGEVTFSYPASGSLALADVEAKVDKAGYTPVWVEVKRSNGKVEKSVSKSKKNTKSLMTSKVRVLGNCGMCKQRIEKAALNQDGVSKASWDAMTQTLTLEYDKSTISLLDIEKSVALAGHDTKNAKASDETYSNLHGCCKYERD